MEHVLVGNSSHRCQALAETILPNVIDNCSLTPYQTGVLDTLAGVRLITSLLGILGSSSIILSALVRCRVKQPDVHPIFMLSVADCLLATLWIGGAAIWYRNAREYKNVWCYAITLITAILECAAINLILVYAVLAYIRVKTTSANNLRMNKFPNIRWYWTALLYLAAWILPLIVIMTLFGFMSIYYSFLRGTNTCSCWCAPNAVNILPYTVAYDEDRYNFMITQQKFVLGLLIVLVINYLVVFISLLVLYTKILQRIKKINMELGHSSGATCKQDVLLKEGQKKARTRIVLFITVFLVSGFFNIAVLLVYIGVLILLFATQKSETNEDRNEDGFPPLIKSIIILLYAQSITLPLQGFLNAVVYGWTRNNFVEKVTGVNSPEVENQIIEFSDSPGYNTQCATFNLIPGNSKSLADSSIQMHRPAFSYMDNSLDDDHLLTSIEPDSS